MFRLVDDSAQLAAVTLERPFLQSPDQLELIGIRRLKPCEIEQNLVLDQPTARNVLLARIVLAPGRERLQHGELGRIQLIMSADTLPSLIGRILVKLRIEQGGEITIRPVQAAQG